MVVVELGEGSSEGNWVVVLSGSAEEVLVWSCEDEGLSGCMEGVGWVATGSTMVEVEGDEDVADSISGSDVGGGEISSAGGEHAANISRMAHQAACLPIVLFISG